MSMFCHCMTFSVLHLNVMSISFASFVPVGKGSDSFFGQRVAVYVALVTLHVKMEARQNSD